MAVSLAPREKYRTFKVLLDEPAASPVLGFDDYARAFADIIVASKPQFAIGIFGSWGSGKTTLMRALESELATRDLALEAEGTMATKDRAAPEPASRAGFGGGIRRRLGLGPSNGTEAVPSRAFIIPVWFNAWRYEREPHMIVPLLDTLREGLADSAAAAKESPDAARLRKAAATVGRTARALAAGLTVKASLTPVDVQFDPKRVMESWSDSKELADEPLSFYHSTFRQMQAAIEDVTRDGRSRIVIFIDDLDRCLPASALEVLEGMKLFFDLEGFVFVVGLDQSVIERSIETKYQPVAAVPTQSEAQAPPPNADQSQTNGTGPTRRPAGVTAPTARAAPVSGAEYIKKLFQVPFALPRINTDDLEKFFQSLVDSNDLPDEQRTDLTDVVKPHLRVATSAESGSINPREIKRLINAYTLQMKMLSAKLDQPPDPNIVVALQTMAFRADWRELYDLLVAAPEVFATAVKDVRDDPTRQTEFPLRNEPLPTTFIDYVRGPAAQLLADGISLEPYVTSAESVGSTNPAVAQARTIIARLRRLISIVSDGRMTQANALAELRSKTSQLYELVDRGASSSRYGPDAFQLVRTLQQEVSAIPAPLGDTRGEPPWASRITEILDSLERLLREVRRETNLNAPS
jgi:hypothetical protein